MFIELKQLEKKRISIQIIKSKKLIQKIYEKLEKKAEIIKIIDINYDLEIKD